MTKCKFILPEVEYLGFKVTQEGTHPRGRSKIDLVALNVHWTIRERGDPGSCQWT